MAKHEWRKVEKDLYAPKTKPEQNIIGKQVYLTIEGKGDPNGFAFESQVEALYAMAYGIRMAPKSGFEIAGYYEYTVYPLEGIWGTDNPEDISDKDQFVYKIMIRQPDFVSLEVFEAVRDKVKEKKKLALLDSLRYEIMEDGMVVQMLHEGTYDSESESFIQMKQYIEQAGLQLREHEHREIYLTDARKVAPEKLKTILRYLVEPKG